MTQYETAYLSVTVLFGVATIWLGVLSYRLKHKRSDLEAQLDAAQGKLLAVEQSLEETKTALSVATRRIDSFREYARQTTVISHLYHDVVLLGPRHAGKSSVAKLWTQPWFDIGELKPSTLWNTYEVSVYDLSTEERQDPLFEVTRQYRHVLRVRLHDYPGDDARRTEAIRALPRLQNAALLLFFDLIVDGDRVSSVAVSKNGSYYSKVFIEALQGVSQLTSNVAKVILVFNKIDLLPSRDKKEIIKMLQAANAEVLSRLETVFGGQMTSVFASAIDNRGLIALLGMASSVGLPKEMQEQVAREIQQLYRVSTYEERQR